MSLFWVVCGVVAQLSLGCVLFMLVAFSAGGIANAGGVSPRDMLLLNAALYVLPLLCLVSAGLIVYGYVSGASARTYGWHLLPLPAAVAYILFALSLSSASR
ncbi:MAG: hypothetical protein ACK5RC_06000 [Curvibacter sp.]